MIPLPPVEGDLLPPVGSKVLIHLNSLSKWVEHEVVGYYVWGNLGDEENLHRVFVRVVDADGILNARLLSDVIPVTRTWVDLTDRELRAIIHDQAPEGGWREKDLCLHVAGALRRKNA
jgi:hypothetical protein